MHLWRKMRRVWLSVSSILKLHKPRATGGKGGERSNASAGLLKLQDDVNMCGYKDVRVMWNLLNFNASQIQQIAGTTTTALSSSSTSQKLQRKKTYLDGFLLAKTKISYYTCPIFISILLG